MSNTIAHKAVQSCEINWVTNVLNNITTQLYDVAGQSLVSINPLRFRTTYLYDGVGRQLVVQDANNNRATSIYDVAGRSVASLNALNIRVTTVYDAANQRLALVDGRANRTSFAYDANGQQQYVMDALLRRTSYGYDSAGQQTLRIDGRSLRTSYFYDAEGKTTGWKYQDQTRATQVYDAVGQRTKVQDWTGRYTYSFDAVGRQTLATDSFAKRITYGFDAVGQRVRMREPDGGRFTYWYDGVGQITRLLNPFLENTTFSYDEAGRRTMQKLANRVRASYSYDNADRLTTLANVRADSTYVSRYDYAYDNTINKTRVIEANGDRVTWSYDRTYQLTREQRSGANAYDTTYSYDASQNRRVMIDSNVRTTYTCDAANQLNWLVDGTGRTTFAYDNNGNQTLQLVTALARTTNVWDGEDRLLQVQRSNTDRSTYTYKSDNLRIVAEEPAATSRIIWDGQIYLIETNASNVTQATYSNEPTSFGNLLSQSRSVISSFYHADSSGSVTNLTDNSAAVTDSYLYRAFGLSVARIGNTTNNFCYIGTIGYYQSKSYYYVLTSWLHPAIARLLSRDGYALGHSINYIYIANLPIAPVDPSSLSVNIPPRWPSPHQPRQTGDYYIVTDYCATLVEENPPKGQQPREEPEFPVLRAYCRRYRLGCSEKQCDSVAALCEQLKQLVKNKVQVGRLSLIGHGCGDDVGVMCTKFDIFGGFRYDTADEDCKAAIKELLKYSGLLRFCGCQVESDLQILKTQLTKWVIDTHAKACGCLGRVRHNKGKNPCECDKWYCCIPGPKLGEVVCDIEKKP